MVSENTEREAVAVKGVLDVLLKEKGELPLEHVMVLTQILKNIGKEEGDCQKS